MHVFLPFSRPVQQAFVSGHQFQDLPDQKKTHLYKGMWNSKISRYFFKKSSFLIFPSQTEGRPAPSLERFCCLSFVDRPGRIRPMKMPLKSKNSGQDDEKYVSKSAVCQPARSMTQFWTLPTAGRSLTKKDLKEDTERSWRIVSLPSTSAGARGFNYSGSRITGNAIVITILDVSDTCRLNVATLIASGLFQFLRHPSIQTFVFSLCS